MENNTEQMYMRYIKSRKANNNSAIGAHTVTRENEEIDNYIDNHTRFLSETNLVNDIEKELADRVSEYLAT